ncbi:MAG: neuromedin U [Planctomycetota bacterium]
MNRERLVRLLCVVLALLGVMMTGPVLAQEGADADSELAKKTQNPISDLISLPFQNNTNFDVGPRGNTQNILNIQPVIPFNLNQDWNLITRTIFPVIDQPSLAPGLGSEFGLGNVNFSGFFSPRNSSEWLWGIGPIFEFPTNTDDVLGSDNWSAGPTFVALKMEGPWVYGGLINQLWSYAGDDPEVNKMLIQPFINYNLPDGWYLSSAPIITANWKADSDNQWTVPVGGGIGKIVRLGKLPVNMSCQAFYNVEKPRYGPDWTLRLQLQLLFPK